MCIGSDGSATSRGIRSQCPNCGRAWQIVEAQTEESRRDDVIEDIVARTGIDEAMIEVLVRAFYARVRLDPLIGPVFESRVHDWEAHMPTPSGKPLP